MINIDQYEKIYFSEATLIEADLGEKSLSQKAPYVMNLE